MLTPTDIGELRQAVVELGRVHVRGGGSKPTLSHDATLSTAKLTGVTAYDPGEFTFTALAGTPIAEIQSMLDEHGQYLPFDPPLAGHGATLGGTVAAGLSGAGRLRFGGLRDFLLGTRMVTGEGRVVFGGGKVVKNAAGFDIPKLMVGAQGSYGVLAELTFKVFPRPEAYATLEVHCNSLEQALQIQSRVAASPLEPACLDLLPPERLLIRMGGLRAAQAARLDRLRSLCEGAASTEVRDDDAELWRAANEFSWSDHCSTFIRLTLAPEQIVRVEHHARQWNAERRYSVAGNVAWIAATDLSSEQIESLAEQLARPAITLRGDCPANIGPLKGDGFRRRLRTVFDPQRKMPPLSDEID